MNIKIIPAFSVFSAFLALAIPGSTSPKENDIPAKAEVPKIQAAILLDVSGSMQGLIEQAKAQLWNMVSVMGKAKCETGTPRIEIALYEYGRTTNDFNRGYVKQISPFTSDLDQLSQELFKLDTDGGDEYCGHVIYSSLNELQWDENTSSYKVIFIAGNEDFLQGDIHYARACGDAKKKGVIVNTIYCGDRLQGIREHWDLGGECGNGSYSHIDHNSREEVIPTPFDSTLLVLNDELNKTYVWYGNAGIAGYQKLTEVDDLNISLGNVAYERVAVKGMSKVYNNAAWDLVDAAEKDSSLVTKLDAQTLPDSLKNKTKGQLKQVIAAKSAERALIQSKIQSVSSHRQAFIAAAKANSTNETATLESEIEKIIKEQAKRFKMKIE